MSELSTSPCTSLQRRGKAIFKSALWLFFLLAISLAGVEIFCYLFPIRLANRPYLNRILDFPEFKTTVRTNSLGLRENSEIPLSKNPNEKRIFLLGDSFVFGFGVERPDTLSAQLGIKLKKLFPAKYFRVVNAASAGTGPLHYAHCVRTIAVPLQADVVVVCLYLGNDLENTVSPYLVFPYSLKNQLKVLLPNTYLWASGWRNNKKISGPGAAPQTIGLDSYSDEELARWGKWEGISRTQLDHRKSNLPGQAQRWLQGRLVAPSYYYSALTHPQIFNDTATLQSKGMRWGLTRNMRALRKIRRMCTKSGSELILVLIPASYQINGEQWDFLRTIGFSLDPRRVQQTKPQEELVAFCDKEGIRCLDLLPALRNAPIRPLHYERDEHWRPSTARYVTEVLCDFLIKEGIIRS